jgi:hypothetical protein
METGVTGHRDQGIDSWRRLSTSRTGRKEEASGGSRSGEKICQSLVNLGDPALLKEKKKKKHRKPGRKPRPR